MLRVYHYTNEATKSRKHGDQTAPTPMESQVFQKRVRSWLPCQAPDVAGSVLELVGLVSVCCDLER